MDKMIERWAMRLAVGNNGGSWDTHYQTCQKEFWRHYAAELIAEIKKDICDAQG